jgi:hypothetical protein
MVAMEEEVGENPFKLSVEQLATLPGGTFPAENELFISPISPPLQYSPSPTLSLFLLLWFLTLISIAGFSFPFWFQLPGHIFMIHNFPWGHRLEFDLWLLASKRMLLVRAS